MMMSKE